MFRLAVSLTLCLASFAVAQKPDAKSEGKPRFAVLYFDAGTTNADLAAFSKGFAALLIADFATNDQLVVVERERLEDVLNELKLGESRFADSKTFAKVGALLGAQYLLVGSLPSMGQKIGVAARVIRVSDARDVGGAKVVISDDNVFAAEEELVKKVTAELNRVGVPPSAQPAPVKTGKLPLKACKTYAQALDAKDKKDTATAKKLLGEVVKQQPDFKLAQLDLLSLTN
jgi:TolB-like protein